MKKGYKETMPKRSHDDDGKPIYGAPKSEMNKYSNKSTANLGTCVDNLQRLFAAVLADYDHTIIEGHRSEDRQRELYDQGLTKTLTSKHNESPSKAVDAAPYLKGRGIPWPGDPGSPGYFKDLAQFYHFAGYVEGVALRMGIKIRWGGDWDSDRTLSDQTFDDLVHFEDVT